MSPAFLSSMGLLTGFFFLWGQREMKTVCSKDVLKLSKLQMWLSMGLVTNKAEKVKVVLTDH